MFWMLFFFGCVSLTALAGAELLDCGVEKTAAPLLLSLILVSYPLALADHLQAAVYLLPGLALVSAVYLLWQTVRNRRLPSALSGPGFWMFSALGAVSWWISRGRMYADWDEFSHWGISVKGMWATDRLYTMAGSTSFPDYPPAMTLLEYLAAAPAPEFREDLTIFALNLFSMALLVWPLCGIAAKGAKKWAVALIGTPLLALVPLAFFSTYYTALTVDGVMGLLLGFAFLTALLEDDPVLRVLVPAEALTVLALCKGAGFPLALMGGLLVFFLLGARQEKRPAHKALSLLARGTPLLLTLLGQALWKWHLSVMEIGSKWEESGFSLQAVADLFHGKPAYRMEVLDRFWKKTLLEPTFGGQLGLSFVLTLLLLGAGCAVAVLLRLKPQRRAAGWAGAGLTLLCAVFCLSLLYSYLFVFQPVEATVLASIGRYLSTPATALWLLTLGMLLTSPFELRRPWAAAALAGLCFFFTLPALSPAAKLLLDAPDNAARTQQGRYLYQHAAERIHSVSDGSDVYVISPLDDGLAVSRIDYECAPVSLPPQDSGIGCLYPEEYYTGYTVYCTPEEWAQRLEEEGFHYVYLYQVDGYFTTGYRELFEDEDTLVNDSLLEVVHLPEGGITLRAVN